MAVTIIINILISILVSASISNLLGKHFHDEAFTQMKELIEREENNCKELVKLTIRDVMERLNRR